MTETAVILQKRPKSRAQGSSVPQIIRILTSSLTLLVAFSPIYAQRYTGTLAGEVSDSAGGKIVGATITATDTTTNYSTKALTKQNGSYAIPFLPPDTYTIAVESIGFQSQVRTGVILTADTNAEADFTLVPGSQTQTVTVEGATQDLMDKESADLHTTLTAQQVTDLPNLGRVPFLFASLAAGMYDATYMTSKTTTGLVPWGNAGTAIMANGVGGSHTIILLNGSIDAPRERITGTGGGYGGLVPSPESVQEVDVQTSMYDAEYGNSGGATINTVLRSGTNDYHGSAYYVFRNTYLNANTYERVPTQNTTTPRINGTWDQPGGVFDGPVRIPHLYDGRNKTYFMVAYEHVNLRGPNTAGETDLVPTAAEAQGDFSALCPGGFGANGVCVSGGGVQIYDPLTLNAENNRTPFPNNQIPASRISPTGAALIKYFPAPNANISSTVNYIASEPVVYEKYYSFVTRVDQSINENNKFNAVFYKGSLNQLYSNMGYPQAIGPTSADETVWRNNIGGSLDYVSALPRNYILDARMGVIYHPFGLVYAGDPFNLSSIGMATTGQTYQTFPGLSMSDSYSGLQAGAGGQISTDTYGSADLTVSKTIAMHELRFGFQGLLERYNAINPISGLGTFAFNREFTQQNSVNVGVGSDASSGNPIAALLLGYPSSGTYAANVSFALQQPWYGFFIQDTWRIARSLTFNLGLRWEDQLPYTERYNRLNTGFCTTCTNPLQSAVSGLTLLGGLEFASSSNRHYYQTESTDWQPRFGVSYQLNPQVVLHGGAGLTYVNSMESPIGQGWTTSTSYVATDDSTHPANSLADPFPTGPVQPSGSALGLGTLIGQNLSFIAPHYVRPRLWQYSASAQVTLPGNTFLQIAYVGNRVYDWEVSKNINALPAQYNTGTASNVTYLQTKVPNPMAGKIGSASSTLNASTIERYYLDLPFPEFGTLTEEYIPAGGSLYNAMQVTVRKTMGQRLTILGTFTWDHEMDSFQYMNAFDANPERFLDPQPSLLGNIALIYQLPRFSNTPTYVRQAFGGWQLNSVFRDYNGDLVTTPSGYIQLADPYIGHQTHLRMFNTCYLNTTGTMMITGQNTSDPACSSASETPAFAQQNTYSIADIGPYMNHVRHTAGTRLDASIFKVFPIHESTSFEVRVEYFNVLNTPTFGAPNTTPGSSNYGQVTLTQENDPRIGQLTARINF